MLRFRLNRPWAFVLTLCLLTSGFFLVTVQLPTVAIAGSGSFAVSTDDPGYPTLGDPDVPAGPGDGKSSVTGKASTRVTSQGRARVVGDGAVSTSVEMGFVQLILLGLRSLYLRF